MRSEAAAHTATSNRSSDRGAIEEGAIDDARAVGRAIISTTSLALSLRQ